ncbi:MAG: homocysteine S-methyltransferase family protein [Candidatus Scalindua sp.]|nr:homocysteine S-methyltransferase family protein [Candidatus Scalindua sp.]
MSEYKSSALFVRGYLHQDLVSGKTENQIGFSISLLGRKILNSFSCLTKKSKNRRMKQLFDKYAYIFTEFAVLERLRRSENVCLHPSLEHSLLIYDEMGRKEISLIYDEYFALQRNTKVPFIIFTPTWRANKERVESLPIHRNINADAVTFMKEIREKHACESEKIVIGGLIGCKNDCYKPDEALSIKESVLFHTWQIDKLIQGGVDFIFAASLPAVSEAEGIAQIMSTVTMPYILSFVIDRKGHLMDGTPLHEAFKTIDTSCIKPPLGFMINCSHPAFFKPERETNYVLSRLIGYQANASDRDHATLDGSADTQVSDISDWGEKMIALNRDYSITILGGCCGTNGEHLRYLAENIDRLP